MAGQVAHQVRFLAISFGLFNDRLDKKQLFCLLLMYIYLYIRTSNNEFEEY